MTKQIDKVEREVIDKTIAAGDVTKVPAGRARGVNKRTAPMTMTKRTKAQEGKKSITKAKPITKAKTSTPTPREGNVLTAPQVAEMHNMTAKTFRSRMRRNPDIWGDLYQREGNTYLFKNNKTTLARITAALS